jgi:hypothetical protein
MSRIDWASLGIFILGFILFLYGANYYNAIVGWIGVFLGLSAIALIIVRYVYKGLTKMSQPQPQKL